MIRTHTICVHSPDLSNTNMGRILGRRWACQRCREIPAEPLEGIVFPSYAAAMKLLGQADAMRMARYKAQRVIEELPVTRTVLEGE